MRACEVHFDLDTRCNYRCVYCPNFDSPDAPKGPLSLAGFGRAMACLSRICWHVFLSCAGEPLLHPDLRDMLASVHKRLGHTDTTLVTNGYLLDHARRDLVLSSGLSRLLVSIDSVDPERYRSLCGTGPDVLARVTSNVERLIQERGRRRWPKVTVAAIAMRSTLPGLAAVAQWACDAGLDGMRVQWLAPCGRPGMGAEVVGGDSPETRDALRRVRQTLRSRGLHFDCPSDSGRAKARSVLAGAALMRNPVEYLVFSARMFLRSRRPRPCRMAGLSLTMLPDYSLHLCPQSVGAVGDASADPAPLLAARIRAGTRALRRQAATECRECRFRTL